MKVGDVIEGRYVVEEVLGEGGMARVFRVRHLGLGSVHALKVLNADLAERAEVRNRFAAEGKIQAQIRHPNIVAVTEVVAEPGLYGLVMEYVEGVPMDAFLAGLTQPPDPELVRAFMLPVLDAMGLAHERGVVHRDLKPENILVGRDVHGKPWPRVSDFGIAKVRQEADDGKATRTGTSMGTRGYMSPEQIKSSRDVSPRSDIFSLGATLYELATLKQAFPGESDYEVMDRIVHERFPPPEEVHPGIDPAIATAITIALRADPAARFATCAEFAAQLRGEAVTVPNPVPAPAPARPITRIRRDTSPDSPGDVLNLETFEPLAAPLAPPPPLSLAQAALDAEIASPVQASSLWEKVLDWAQDWPAAVRDTLKLVSAERHPVLRLSTSPTFERRELKARNLPFPRELETPVEVSPRSDLDPFDLRLPIPAVAPGHSETFAVAGSLSVRTCAACRAQGSTLCTRCGGEGSSKCASCSGTGQIACVLCDGTGAVTEMGGERMVICPNCQGTNLARCLATGCDGGHLACADCQGAGSRQCHACAGAGRLAKATVVTRHAQMGDGTAWVQFNLPAAALDALASLSDEGTLEVSADLDASTSGIDFRLRPFLEQTEAPLAAELDSEGSEWRVTRRKLELRRLEAWRVTYSSLHGEHQVWLLGTSGMVVGETTPVGAWRKGILEEVERLAQAGDAAGLKSSHLAEAFDPGDQRVAELGQRLGAELASRWDRGEVAQARTIRDAAPRALVPALTHALASREEAMGAERSRKQRGWLVASCVLGLSLAAAIAAALGLGPR